MDAMAAARWANQGVDIMADITPSFRGRSHRRDAARFTRHRRHHVAGTYIHFGRSTLGSRDLKRQRRIDTGCGTRDRGVRA